MKQEEVRLVLRRLGADHEDMAQLGLGDRKISTNVYVTEEEKQELSDICFWYGVRYLEQDVTITKLLRLYINLQKSETIKQLIEKGLPKFPEGEDAILLRVNYSVSQHQILRKLKITYRADKISIGRITLALVQKFIVEERRGNHALEDYFKQMAGES